jgi:nucleoid-associated protein YgaU
MNRNQLAKATISTLKGERKVITVLFNPTEYSFERSNSYKTTSIPGLGSPLIQFVNGECDQLSMELFMDDYTDPNGPTSQLTPESQPLSKRLKELSGLLNVNRQIHAPPPVEFRWGSMVFHAIIEKLGRKVTMFHPDGTPARVTLSVSFKEYRTLKELIEDPRRESADKTKRRVTIGKEQLWAIAAREYDSASEWVLIAEANDLDDPRDIKPGDWLTMPAVEYDHAAR